MASSVIDIAVGGPEDAMRVMGALSSAVVSKPSEYSNSSAQTQYIERENIVRASLWDDIRFVSAVMEMVITMIGSRSEI
ncbi:MAG: hypothetical protein LBG71_01740 [Clostridiales Family XIII bacterium]|jgi:hypothetical protein|nr:hypothetical protein [Clostridiales Family XIII bacterium]